MDLTFISGIQFHLVELSVCRTSMELALEAVVYQENALEACDRHPNECTHASQLLSDVIYAAITVERAIGHFKPFSLVFSKMHHCFVVVVTETGSC